MKKEKTMKQLLSTIGMIIRHQFYGVRAFEVTGPVVGNQKSTVKPCRQRKAS